MTYMRYMIMKRNMSGVAIYEKNIFPLGAINKEDKLICIINKKLYPSMKKG
jgi:hypothetical protein